MNLDVPSDMTTTQSDMIMFNIVSKKKERTLTRKEKEGTKEKEHLIQIVA